MTIVFLRTGRFEGTKIAIDSAREWSPKSRVILIADKDYGQGACEFHDIAPLLGRRNNLNMVYRHSHDVMPPWWVLQTLGMWVVLESFMIQKGINQVCALDTDVLTFCDLDRELEPYAKFDGTLSNPLGNPQCPMMVTLPFLSHFVDYLFDFYRNINDLDYPNGFVCGMWLWKNFCLRNPSFSVGNTSLVVNGSTFDHNLCMDYGDFEHDGQTKIMRFKNGQPYCRNVKTDEDVRFNTLHCWGMWKDRMAELVGASRASMSQCHCDTKPSP